MSKKLTYEYVKNFIESIKGYYLISKEYKNNHSKLKIKCTNCKEPHIFEKSFVCFKRRQRCQNIGMEILSEKLKHSYNYIKEQIEKVEGYFLKSKEYLHGKQILEILCTNCKEPHIFPMCWNNFQQGERCPNIGINNRIEKRKLEYKYVKEFIESKGYKLLSKEYKNNYTNLEILCTNCEEDHIFEMSWNSFQQYRCSICDKIKFSSKPEKEVLSVVKELIPKELILENDRTQIINPKTRRNLELDIYLPNLNKAIEFNGKYFHGDDFPDVQYKDKQKVIQCKEKNIQLLVIKEENWIVHRKEQVQKIKQFIGGMNK